jgi:hypothetical protein
MSRKIVLLVVLLAVTVLIAGEKQPKVIITVPADKSKVLERPTVEGTVSDVNASVWVVVHSMATSDYRVQPSVSFEKDGTWKVKIYIGKQGNVDVGKHFEIMAVANPKGSLREGDVLKSWPEAQAKSQVIEVTRQ